MSWVAAGTAAVAVVGSMSSSSAAKKQKKSNKKALEFQRKVWEQQRKDTATYRKGGEAAQARLSGLLSEGGGFDKRFGVDDFETEPGYQFRMEEGAKGVERGAAARGGALSGRALKAMEKYRQGFASNEYGNAYNRFNQDRGQKYNMLMGQVGSGLRGAGMAAAANQAYGAQGTNQMVQRGNIGADKSIGIGNAISQGIAGMANNRKGQEGQDQNTDNNRKRNNRQETNWWNY